jgi:hypothetical protein
MQLKARQSKDEQYHRRFSERPNRGHGEQDIKYEQVIMNIITKFYLAVLWIRIQIGKDLYLLLDPDSGPYPKIDVNINKKH